MYLLLALKAPTRTRKMDTNRLRDSYLVEGIYNEKTTEFLKAQVDVADRSKMDFIDLHRKYTFSILPWMKHEMREEHMDLREKYNKLKEEGLIK